MLTKDGLRKLGFYETVADTYDAYVKDVGDHHIIVIQGSFIIYLSEGNLDHDSSWVFLPIKTLDGIMALIDLLTTGK